jgi:hypothetical protein
MSNVIRGCQYTAGGLLLVAIGLYTRTWHGTATLTAILPAVLAATVLLGFVPQLVAHAVSRELDAKLAVFGEQIRADVAKETGQAIHLARDEGVREGALRARFRDGGDPPRPKLVVGND